jgi:hypothetical protein
MAMKDFSTILLINMLRATVEHLQQSPEIDQASPGVEDLKHTLRAQIVRLRGTDPEHGGFTVDATPEAGDGFK